MKFESLMDFSKIFRLYGGASHYIDRLLFIFFSPFTASILSRPLLDTSLSLTAIVHVGFVAIENIRLYNLPKMDVPLVTMTQNINESKWDNGKEV